MSKESRWAPKGSGWKKNRVPKGSPCLNQWTHAATGCIRCDCGEYVEIIHPSGWRQYSGEGGGILTFHPDGSVEVHWNGAAALTSAHGAGNRKLRITKATPKRAHAQLDETFAMIAGIRESFIIPPDHAPSKIPHEIPGLPTDPDSSQAIELTRIFHREAYQMLSAIVKGDADEIKRIAAAVEHHEGIRTDILQTPMEGFLDIAEAIREAAIQAGGIPSRPSILKEYSALAGNRGNISTDSLREKLGKMGFAWLHATHGKRGKREG